MNLEIVNRFSFRGVFELFCSICDFFSGHITVRKKIEKLTERQSVNSLLADQVHQAFIQRKKTLALAESCTGGALAVSLVVIPEASLYFLGSIVAYSPECKQQFLKVSSQTLQRKGAESRETVQEMIDGLFSQMKSDYAVAISGFAGPTGAIPGRVFIGIAKWGEPADILEFQLIGTRKQVIDATVEHALRGLLEKVVSSPHKYYEGLQ